MIALLRALIAAKFVLCFAFLTPVFSQSYVIDDFSSQKNLVITPSQAGLLGFYKRSTQPAKGIEYKRIVLNDKMKLVESNVYGLDQDADLIAYVTCGDRQLYAFANQSRLNFLLIGAAGETLAAYHKTIQELEGILERPLSRVDNLKLELAASPGNPDEVIAYIHADGGFLLKEEGRVFGFDLLSGSEMWRFTESIHVSRIIAIQNTVVLLCQKNAGVAYPDYFMYFIDLISKAKAKVDFGEKKFNYVITAMAPIDNKILIMGNQFKLSPANSNLFTFVYNLNGNVVSQKVSARPDKSKLQFNGLGYVYNENGDLLVIGESFRRISIKPSDAQIMARTILGGVSIPVVSAGSLTVSVILVPPTTSGGMQNVVENLKVYAIKASDFSIDESLTFQTDRRKGFTTLRTFDKDILLRLNNKIWYYDPTSVSSPPRFLTNLPEDKDFTLTHFGPVSILFENRQIILENLLAAGEK